MRTFQYKGFSTDGKPCKGLVEALNIKDAREKLAAGNVLAEKIVPTGQKQKFLPEARAVVYRELSSLLHAGLPMVRALDLMIESPEMDQSQIILASVRDRVKEGASLAQALSDAGKSMSSYEYAIIQAAEQSATVEDMLERLADFIEEQQRIKDRVQGALIYPSIVLVLGLCVAIVMLGVFVPRAQEMLESNNVPLPPLTRLMTDLGGVIIKWGWVPVSVFAGFIFFLRSRMKTDKSFAVRINSKVFNVPIWGRGQVMLANLRFSRTLSILLAGGVSVVEGFGMAGRATGSVWIGELAERESEAVRNGASLADAVRRIPPLSDSLPGWIQTGEASGDLVKMLESAGRRYQDRWDRYISRCLGILEPTMMLLIGGFVLLVALSILLPVISVGKSIAG